MTDVLFDPETSATSGTPVTGVAEQDPAAGRTDTTQGEGVGDVRPVVVGLDLSLTRTGVATADRAHSLSPPKQLREFPRMRWIRARVLDLTNGADLVVVEAPAFSSNGKFAKEIAGLWHVVMIAVDARGTRWIDAMSNTRMKYATGSGRAGKDEVLAAAIRRLPIEVNNNDEADAAWLCALGHDLLDAPLVDLPAAHRSALAAVRARLEEASR